jgi:predicted nucleotidyltransferase
MALPATFQAAQDRIVARLRELLGANLYSCILYGSAVRGDLDPRTSDLNLLLILNESTPDAHTAIASVVRGQRIVDPFVITRRAMDRTFEAFALKFLSIKRNYRVLAGADPLVDLSIDEQTQRFECEQALRNLRLRAVRAYIFFGDDGARYTRFLLRVETPLFIYLSAALRLVGTELPKDFNTRISLFKTGFDTDVSLLTDLASLGARPRDLDKSETRRWHERLFRLLDHAVRWMEDRWPKQP